MLVKLFKANYFYNFILFPLFGLALLAGSFVLGDHLNIYSEYDYSFLFFPFYEGVISHKAAVLINFAAIMIIGVELLHLNSRFTFSNERTFLPVYIFMFIVLALTEFHIVQPIILATIFMIWALRILFNAYEKRSAISEAFNAGLFIGIASLFCIHFGFLVILVPLGILIIRNTTTWREMLVPFIGALLPWIFFVCFFILTDNIERFQLIIDQYFKPLNTNTFRQWPVLSFFAYIFVLILISNLKIIKQYGLMNIAIRRYYKVFALFFSLSIILLFLPFVSHLIIVFMAVPLSFLITNMFLNIRKSFWAELLMGILVIAAFTLQYIR